MDAPLILRSQGALRRGKLLIASAPWLFLPCGCGDAGHRTVKDQVPPAVVIVMADSQPTPAAANVTI